MKKIILLSVLLSLSACFHEVDEPKKVEAKIPYPDLSTAQTFKELELEPEDLVITEDNAEDLVRNFLVRSMNILEIGNLEISQVSTNNPMPALYKAGARSLTPIGAWDERCDNENSERLNTESLIWNDVNDDGKHLEGDKWYIIMQDCRNAASGYYVTGVIEYSGMEDFLNENSSAISDEFDDYEFKLDLQVEYAEHLFAYFEQADFVFSREINDDEEITNMVVKANSKMGVTSDAGVFLLDVNELNAEAKDVSETLTFSVEADYIYQDAEEAAHRVTATTPEALSFAFEINTFQNDRLINVVLNAGELTLTGDNSSVTLMVIDEENVSLAVDEDGDGTEDVSIDVLQSDLFPEARFRLLNIIGE